MSSTVLPLNSNESGHEPRRTELVARLSRLATTDGRHQTAIEAVQIIRASTPTQALPALYEPALCVVVQGRKHALLHGETYVYDPLRYLVVSVAMPIIAQIIEASPERPYLCLRINIDARELGSLLLDGGAPSAGAVDRGLYSAQLSEALLDAVLRLVRLLDTPEDVPVLAPLVLREIHYRSLTGELGHRLRALALVDSRAERIHRTLQLLRERYAQNLSLEQLAQTANMSLSSLHQHFKAVTAMSPLQYQKQLRLHEAQRLMLGEGLEAASAAHRVGYESASQFSREYKRLFGVPPRQQIEALRRRAGEHRSP
ncbi:Helix-turn-helix domain-containing protein [Solimonas aquatica]|uniref:Helix-turn-helix domain-containing protein n=1 Tax=Solimonas aquatica TaxID=489703 RepID=A0A1H9DMT8_9GAMM|nr:AraC family transcriptional regulator [Solimonas aquatica]SEQ14820.1 Helix-turn-helix domain-containing protein [Solimonas aquatica]